MAGGSLRWLVGFFGTAAIASTVALPAGAESSYPALIQKELGGGCAPQCTLCHTRPEGGGGSDNFLKPNELTTPGYTAPNLPANQGQGEFLANLIHVNNHRQPVGDTELRGALTLLATANCSPTATAPCDSDGDGVQDTNEFAMDRDPDLPNDRPGDLCVGPKYGCGAHIGNVPRESSATREAAAAIALLGVGLVFLRRSRRR